MKPFFLDAFCLSFNRIKIHENNINDMHAGRGPDDRSRMFGTGTTQGSAEPSRVLIAYYSWGGNTKYAAAQIQRATGGTLFEIKPVKPYPSEYRECTVQARKEIQEGVRPELAAKVEDMGKYDVIFIGSPNWWSTIAPPVASFLASYDLSGKTVIPFVTHGGGGMARCADEVRKLCPKSTVLKGGAFAGEGIRTTRAALVKWVNETISINK